MNFLYKEILHGMVLYQQTVQLSICSFKSEAPVNGLVSNKSIFSCVFNLLWLYWGISASRGLEGDRWSLLNMAQVCFPQRFSPFFFPTPFLLQFEGWECFSSWPHSEESHLGFVWGLGWYFSFSPWFLGFLLFGCFVLAIGLCWNCRVVIPGEWVISSFLV